MGPTWGPSGADRFQVGPMLAPWTLLSGQFTQDVVDRLGSDIVLTYTMNHLAGDMALSDIIAHSESAIAHSKIRTWGY